MKKTNIRFILCMMIAFSSLQTIGAKKSSDSITDSLKKTDPLVQVAYRNVLQSNIMGGVSVVDVEDLLKKNYNTYSMDNMQGYVGGWNGNSLWGMDDYLVLIDGVPRDANNVLPTEIDKITFLKSASAVVLYGSRGAKGVVSITTKRGRIGDRVVSVRANTGYNVAKSYPKYLGSAEYMTLYNEALTNDGLAGPSTSYSDEAIYNHSTGLNPYRYPDLNFYSSDYLRKSLNRSDVTAEISGGNDRAQFYTNVSYYNQEDYFKFGQAKDNNLNRLNVRGNIDINVNPFIKASVDANATFYNARNAKGDYWAAASTLRPNRISPLVPISFIESNDINSLTMVNNTLNIIDGKYFLGGTQQDLTNIFADYYAAGYSKYTSRQFQFDTKIDFDLRKVLQGLTFNTMFAVDYATTYNTSFDNTYSVFVPSWSNYNGADVISQLEKFGVDKKSGVQNISGSTDRQTIAFSGQFNYNTTINDVHNISAVLVGAGYQRTESEVYHRITNANLGLMVNYNYANKYFVDLGASEVHSARLAEGNRNAFSPSATLGWKLKNENFLANASDVDELTLSASGSILNTDMDISNYYMYESNYNQAGGAWWGWYDGASERSTNSVRGANKDLTFIKRKEFSVNASTSLFKNTVSANASFFINSMEGLIIRPATIYPSYFSTYYPEASFIPYANFNNNKRTGFDVNVNLKKRIGAVDFNLGVAATYYSSEATKRDENYQYDYQNRTGKQIDGVWGLQTLGFFADAQDVSNSPAQKFGGIIKPGDLKYVDQNNDNVIDEKDEVYLGRGGWYGAPLTLGVNLTAKYKGFTFFALGTGGYGAVAMKNSTYYWVYGNGKYSENVRGRWTEATKETATYPRLTTLTGANNFRNSDFWLYKTDRFNLAKVQISYDLPKSMLENGILKEVSAYISGSNLLTVSKQREVLELNTTSAPQARFYNVGVKVVF